MEHRYDTRTRIALKVIVFNRGLPVAVGKTKNISREGLFVNSYYNDDVSVHQPLEIQFAVSGQRCPVKLRIQVCVVHKTESGFGLALVDDSATASENLMKLIDIATDNALLAIPRTGSAARAAFR